MTELPGSLRSIPFGQDCRNQAQAVEWVLVYIYNKHVVKIINILYVYPLLGFCRY